MGKKNPMGLFNRSRMTKAEDLAVRIGENLLRQSLLDPEQRGHGQQELVLALARRVCQVNPAWTLAGGVLERCDRDGNPAASAHLAELPTALDLLGLVIDADLREHGKLAAHDHDQVLMQALRRLSTALEQRALSEVSQTLAPERESAALWQELAESGDDAHEIASARAQLEELAEGLLTASYGALAFADFLNEANARPLTALRFFAARNSAWALHRGELFYRGASIGRYSNDEPVNSIYADMVWGLLEQDHPFLSESTLRELTLAAMRSWDRELAVLYLRAGTEPDAARRA
jgi:hypothetical protein